ncbi:uncharacterized protein LOC143079045 [Mytilus galloprovincialis]|uniref:uncharacterized protein LOC143079045 n=1 Tax=Mytilus galloprovincialis TaxID=29158 RepID=UPI003F7C68FB
MMLLVICIAVCIAVVDSANDAVAFTKGLVSHAHLTKGEIIKFDKSITNINADFTGDGKFLVQTPGIYSFHFHALSRKNEEIWLDLYKNKDYIVSIYAYTINDWADASNTVVLELQKGDLIFVKAVDNYENWIYGATDDIYTTFSGELVVPETTVDSSVKAAFCVSLTHNMTLNGDHVVYDKIITNVGNGYDANTGVFTVSVPGLYMIHYHALAQLGKRMWLDLYQNDKYINTAFGEAPSTYADHGNSAILELHVGDKVWVSGRPGDTVILYGDASDEQLYATFTAFLLSPAQHGIFTTVGNDRKVPAFSVGLTHDIDNTQTGLTTHNVMFDRVWTNQGGVFNMATGEFRAIVHGVYVFHYHAISATNMEVLIELYHKDQYIDSLYGHHTNGWAGGSNSATLRLSVDDTVYLHMSTNSTTEMPGSPSAIYTTFSGYLLSPITN